MVLNISGERKDGRSKSDADKSIIPVALLGKILDGIPRVDGAIIDGNKVSMNISSEHDRKMKCLTPYDVPVSVSYTQNGNGKGHVEMTYTHEGMSNIVLQNSEGFHRIVNEVFGGNRLEETGLEAPSSLKVDVKYSMPFAIWRTLPEEFRKNIKSFSFRGPMLMLGYEPDKDKEVLLVSANSSRILGSDIDQNQFEFFRDRLTRTGLVKYVSEQGKNRRDYFSIIDKERIAAFGSLEKLEEIVMLMPEGKKPDKERSIFDREGVELLVKGEFSRDSFYHVPSIFDNAKQDIEVHGSVVGGRISVSYDGSRWQSNKDRPLSVVLRDATLEDAERLVTLHDKFARPLEGCSLAIEAFGGDKGAKVYQIKI